MDGKNDSARIEKDAAPLPYRFTEEELRIIHQCNREAFYYRCLPLTIVSCAAINVLGRRGVFNGSPYFGNWLKYGAAIGLSTFLGRFSYRTTTEARLLEIDSPFANALKMARAGEIARHDIFRVAMEAQAEAESPAAAPEVQSKRKVYNDINNSDSNVQNQGMDDSMRPSFTGATLKQAKSSPSEAGGSFTSYDNLRQTNRQEFDRTQESRRSKSSQAPTGQPSRAQERPSTIWDNAPSSKYVKRNQYGDVVEE